MTAILRTLAGKLLAGVAVFAIVAGAYFLWESRVRRAAVIELQRDQLAAAIRAKDAAIADRNRIWAQVSNLPEVRLRLCAQRPATDGCCRPAPAECKP